MAQGRRHVLGELAAYQIAWVAKLITGQQLDPAAINPYPIRAAKSAKLKELEAWQARRRWRNMLGGESKES